TLSSLVVFLDDPRPREQRVLSSGPFCPLFGTAKASRPWKSITGGLPEFAGQRLNAVEVERTFQRPGKPIADCLPSAASLRRRCFVITFALQDASFNFRQRVLALIQND